MREQLDPLAEPETVRLESLLFGIRRVAFPKTSRNSGSGLSGSGASSATAEALRRTAGARRAGLRCSGSRTGTLLPAPGPPTGNLGCPPRLHAAEPSTTPRPCAKPLWMRCVRRPRGFSRAHAPGKLHRPVRTRARCFPWSTNIAPGNPRFAPASSHRCTSGRTSHTGFMWQGISRTASSGRDLEFRRVRGGVLGPAGTCRRPYASRLRPVRSRAQ